ncbi:MAG: hypothetical protein STSR0009_30800 [Methanoregula sp.]
MTRSRDAQGLGLTAEAVRYLRALLRRPLGALALIPTTRARFTLGGGTATPPSFTVLWNALLPPKGG